MMRIYSKHPINSAAWVKRGRGFALAVRHYLVCTFMINVLSRLYISLSNRFKDSSGANITALVICIG